jgi:hypothetical protein
MTTEIKNYGVTIANLTETEELCLDFVTSSIQNTLNSMVDSQIQFGKNSILAGLKDYCFENGITPATTEDGKILQAFALGIAKPVAQRIVEEISQED